MNHIRFQYEHHQNKAAVKAYVEELTEYSKTLTQSNLQKAVLNSTEIATKNVLLSLQRFERTESEYYLLFLL